MTSPKMNKLAVFFCLGRWREGTGNPCVKKEGRKERTGGTQADDGDGDLVRTLAWMLGRAGSQGGGKAGQTHDGPASAEWLLVLF